jgi:Tol biopolymer transport system component
MRRASTSGRLAGLLVVGLALLGVVGCASALPTPLPLVLAAPLAQGAGPTPSGSLAFVVNGDIWEWRDGAVRQLTTGTRYEGPAWSPDGDQLAVSMVGTNHADIALLGADGEFQTRLTDNRGRLRIQDSDWARLPAWAPDGGFLAYASDSRTYDLALWLIGVNGRGARQVLAGPDGFGGIDHPSWSPDGTEIAVGVWRQGAPPQIEIVSVGTGRTRRITDAATGAYDAAWSPEGTWVAHAVRDGTRHDVWLVRPDGTGTIRLTTSGRNRMPAWSPDGQWLAFLSLSDTGFDVRVAPVPTGDAEIEPTEGRVLVSARAVEGASGLSWGP